MKGIWRPSILLALSVVAALFVSSCRRETPAQTGREEVSPSGDESGAQTALWSATVAERDMEREGAPPPSAPSLPPVPPIPTEVKLERVSWAEQRTEITLFYMSPIEPLAAAGGLKVLLNGTPVANFEVEEGEKPESLELEVKFSGMELAGERNKLELIFTSPAPTGKEGTPSPGGRQFVVDLGQAPAIVITWADAEESATGFYLQIYCEDNAAERSWSLCEFRPEELQAKVHITPEIHPSFSPGVSGFRIFGEFKAGEYQLRMDKGLTTIRGGILLNPYETTVVVPARSAKAEFPVKGRYVARSRLSAVPVRHVNVDEVEVKVRQIPEQNLVFWLAGENELATDQNSDLIAQKTYSLPRVEDQEMTTWLDFSDLAPAENRGVFEFHLQGGTKPDALHLILTRLGVAAKRFGPEGRDLMLWVFDAETLEPKPGAAVDIYTSSNRRLASAATDRAGVVRFTNLVDPLAAAGREPFAVIVRTGNDLTALRFDDLKIPLEAFPAGGAAYKAPSPYRAAIYSDRGVYRPGETAHVVAVVWEAENHAPAEPLPLVARLRDPRGREAGRFTAQTNPSGLAAFDLPFLAFAPTGKYEFLLEIGGRTAATHSLHVEEFMPERMKVSAEPWDKGVLFSEAPSFQIRASYLFGAKAAGEIVELECTLEENRLSFAAHPGYSFGPWQVKPAPPLPLGTVRGSLDEEGEALMTCPVPATSTPFVGPSVLNVLASVTEGGSGRTSTAHASVPVHPDRYYLGLKASASEAKTGQPITIHGIMTDWEGNLVREPHEVKVEYVELETEWVWEWDDDSASSTWKPFFREHPVGSETVTTKDGRFRLSFTPSQAAWGYLVRTTAGSHIRTDLYLKGEGFSWWWGDYNERVSQTPRPISPEGLELEVPKKMRVGEKAEVKINLPHPGRLLFTVETDRVLESRWEKVRAGPYTASFSLREFAPNVYVSALLIKDPKAESPQAFLPGRMFGLASIPIDPVPFQRKLSLEVPAEVRPGEELVVRLKTEPDNGPVHATLAAVDEGILQLTDFPSPDPLKELFKKCGLGVATFETVGWTLLLPGRNQSTGGDGAPAEEAGPPGRMPAVKPVALWSGIIPVKEDGTAEVRFSVPLYRGRLRVMAVAAGPNRIGAAEAQVFVRDPVVLQTTAPRFLLTHDTFVLPVFLTNTTSEGGTAEVEIRLSENLKLNDAAVKSVSLPPGESRTVTFLLQATAGAGAGEVQLETRLGEHKSRDEVLIPLLPHAPVSREVSLVKLQTGANDLTSFLAGWQPQFEQTTITLTANQYARELGHLKYLLRYPYGCIEQTISSTRPLLFISSLINTIDPEISRDGTIEQKLRHGLQRILSMQTLEGGFSYWPGESEHTLWGTAYAAHLLLEALEQGYPLDRSRIDDALTFMERKLAHADRLTDPAYRLSLVAAEPYMQFVLARAGRPQTKRMENLLAQPPAWGDLQEENLFLLKAALYLAGNRTYEAHLKNAPLTISDRRQNSWSFWSDLRTRGLMLNILEDLFSGSQEAEVLAQAIADRLRQAPSHYYTTQELAWCVSGLGKRAAGGARQWSEPLLTLDGEKLEPLPTSAPEQGTVWVISSASRAKSLQLKVESIEGGNLFSLVQVEGIKPGVEAKDEDQNLKVRRRYLNSLGDPINPEEIPLGGVVYMELTLANLTSERLLNVALVDRFAAGFDLENPRLGRQHITDFIPANKIWETSYVDFRDDRIELFGHLEPGQEVKTVYALRAVVGGHFATPPVRAEVMYDPRIFSQQTGAPVTIRDPWGALTH